MGVFQQSDPQVVDLSEPSNNSTETSSRETTVRFKDVDSSSPGVQFVAEPDVLKAGRLLFEAFGFSILTTDYAEKALDLLQTDETDAVVLNYVLPGMDGDQPANRIREARGKIPIILLDCSSLRQMLLEIVKRVRQQTQWGKGPARSARTRATGRRRRDPHKLTRKHSEVAHGLKAF